MFTGIVEDLGEVAAVEQQGDSARIHIRSAVVTSDARPGDSICVNGVCLTVTSLPSPDVFTADVMGETLARSSLRGSAAGTRVNLERSVRLQDRLGGHLVQGHVDGTAVVISRVAHEHWEIVRLSLPRALGRYVVHKGSIAIDGVSLTVSAVSPGGDDPPHTPPAHGGAARPPTPPGPAGPARAGDEGWLEVSLIPETLKRTTLGLRQPGDEVNLEVDVIAKYVERLFPGGAQ
jgi:riboflavin synthase